MQDFLKSEKLRNIFWYLATRVIIIASVVAIITIAVIMFDDSPSINQWSFFGNLLQFFVLLVASISSFYYSRRIQNKLGAIWLASFSLAFIYVSFSYLVSGPHFFKEEFLPFVIGGTFWSFALFFLFFVFYFARTYGSKNIFLSIGVPLLFYQILFFGGLLLVMIGAIQDGFGMLWLGFWYLLLLFLYLVLAVLIYFFWPSRFEPILGESPEIITRNAIAKRRFLSTFVISSFPLVFYILYATFSTLLSIFIRIRAIYF